MLSPWRCLFYGTQWRTCPSVLSLVQARSALLLLELPGVTLLSLAHKTQNKCSEIFFLSLTLLSKNKRWILEVVSQKLSNSRVVQRPLELALHLLPFMFTLVFLWKTPLAAAAWPKLHKTVSVWVAMEMWWFISLAVHNINRQINESPRSYLRSIMKMNETLHLHCVSCDWFVPGCVIFSPSSLRFRFASSL